MEAEKLELSERIERRLEMIHAHTKHGKRVRSVIEEFNVSLGTYYYWYPRYVEMGIFGLFDSKRGPKTPHNKTSDNVASKVVDTADYHPELDAQEILKVLECSSGHKPSVSTVQRILRSKGMNRPKGRRSKKNDGEKEDKNSSLQEGVKKVKKKREGSNVYTNPLTNPQRNPNVDSKRTEPLTVMEIEAIKEVNQQYPELGSWNLSLLLSNEFDVHVSTMSILRVLDPERYKSSKIAEKVKFYEKPRPHVMYHADTMEVTLGNGSLIYQISVEDDYSRGYMALCVFPKKLSYFVVLTILRAFRLHSKPELFHHDNGGEYDNGVVSRLLQMLGIVDVPTEVENPKGNGKKERAHSQDRKDFYDKYLFWDIESVEKAIPEYLRFRNESKGQWARYGKTASSVLKDAEAKPLTDEELERAIRELYFEKTERKVKQDGKVKFEGKWYHVSKEMFGETVEMKVTLRGMEAWHNGAFVKRWKYWEYVLGIAADYMLEKCLL